MAETASGILSLPLEHLRSLLANSATWKTWTGSADATAAKAYIHKVETPDDSDRPWALIDQGNEWMSSKAALGTFFNSGTLLLKILADVPEGYDAHDAQIWFTNQVGAVLAEMEALAADEGDGYLAVDSIKLLDLYRPEEKMRSTEGDYISAVFEVHWQ